MIVNEKYKLNAISNLDGFKFPYSYNELKVAIEKISNKIYGFDNNLNILKQI